MFYNSPILSIPTGYSKKNLIFTGFSYKSCIIGISWLLWAWRLNKQVVVASDLAKASIKKI